MRMLFFVVLLIIPGMARAVNSDCRQITGQNTQTTCENTAGCHWENECYPCDEDHYCPGNNNEQTDCSTVGNGNFDKSDEGSESSAECYKQITCEKADGAPDNNCRHYNTSNNPYRCGSNLMTHAHIESDTCYYNFRNCQKFTSDGCTGTIRSLDIPWTGNEWDVSYCECIEPFSNNSSLNCSGQQTKKTTSQSASNVNETIHYTDGEITQYECRSCLAGYYVQRVYYIFDSDRPAKCTPYSGQYSVCSCVSTPQGTYSENCSWSDITDGTNPCPKYDCPNPGQTTNGDGAGINQNACHYTSDTQFCDAKGCFSLSESELIEWGLNNP